MWFVDTNKYISVFLIQNRPENRLQTTQYYRTEFAGSTGAMWRLPPPPPESVNEQQDCVIIKQQQDYIIMEQKLD